MLEEHGLVAEETGAPQKPRRSLQRKYTNTHNGKPIFIHLTVRNFTAERNSSGMMWDLGAIRAYSKSEPRSSRNYENVLQQNPSLSLSLYFDCIVSCRRVFPAKNGRGETTAFYIGSGSY